MAGHAYHRYLRFWTEERSLSVMLALLVVHFFVLSPVNILGRAFHLAGAAILFLSLLAGVLSLERASFRRMGTFLVAGAVTFRTAAAFSGDRWLLICDTLFTLLSLAALILVVYRQVSQEGPVNGHLLRGAVALYLLIAVLFAFLYGLAEQLVPGAFNIPGSLFTETARGETFYYFSIVTLTTVGFGDITAVHPFARSLVMLEALIGQLYPAILIARLVTLHIETRRSGR